MGSTINAGSYTSSHPSTELATSNTSSNPSTDTASNAGWRCTPHCDRFSNLVLISEVANYMC